MRRACGTDFTDDDGSFMIKHASLNFYVAPVNGGATSIGNGERLVWKACPTNCVDDFSRDDYLSNGFVFENDAGDVCLPVGV